MKDYEGKEELLSHPTTLEYFRKELFLPSPIIDRNTRDAWKNLGSKSTRKRAIDVAEKLLQKPSIKPIDESLQGELNKITSTYLK